MVARVNRAPSSATHAAAAVLVLLVVGCGLIRLNPFCLLEPDSADYLFTSRALAVLDGYREIDHPAASLHAFRPPGLPLLLAPLSAMLPYDVEAAKLVILGSTALLLVLVFHGAVRASGPWGGLAALALVASSPYTMLHGTEVLAEVPYLAAMLGVVALTSGDGGLPGRGRLVGAGLLLALLPLLRTIGLALLVAIALWTLFDRTRRRWWAPLGFGIVVNALWIARNARTGVPTYIAAMRRDLLDLGVAGYAAKAGTGFAYYADRFGDVLLPGVFGGEPLYERLLIGGAPDLAGAFGGGSVLVLLALGLAGLGLYRRRAAEGGIVALYACLFVALLAVYPPRHERLTWPLIPLVWLYAPAGVRWFGERIGTASTRRASGAVALLAATAICAWQGAVTVSIVGTEIRRERAGPTWHGVHVPPIYFSDWQAAGRSIAGSTPPHTRVLSRHSDVGFSARRFQDSLRFEEVSPAGLQRTIARLGARRLVLPTTLFDWLVPAAVRSGSPVYEFDELYRDAGVVVFDVLPNRSGLVRLDDADLGARLAACREAVSREPARVDLVRRLAELLLESGQTDEALRTLDGFTERHGPEVGVARTRGSLLLELGRPAQALAAFRFARTLPGAESFVRTLDRGVERARERNDRLDDESPARAARRHVEAAVAGMRAQTYRVAWREIERATAAAPDDPAVWSVRAAILEHVGRRDEARTLLARLASAGDDRARASLERLVDEERLFAGAGPSSAQEVLRVGARLAGEGRTGRALALLERAAVRHSASDELQLRLAELYLFYGQPERARPLLLALERSGGPHADAVAGGLERCRALLREPEY